MLSLRTTSRRMIVVAATVTLVATGVLAGGIGRAAKPAHPDP
jgi:hypothetical protein